MKYLIVATVLFVSGISLEAGAAELKSFFCTDNIVYAQYGPDCELKCGECRLDELKSDGWKIEAATHQEIVREDWWSGGGVKLGCTCIGTKYTLSKEKKNDVVPVFNETLSKEAELCKKEVELYKKENEALKKDNKILKAKIKVRKHKIRKFKKRHKTLELDTTVPLKESTKEPVKEPAK